MEKVATAPLVARLRELLAARHLGAYYIPTQDPHMTETPPARWLRRAYITGFSGSAGSAIVTAKEALLWTDGRYFLQAEQELDPEVWTLMKAGLPEVPTIEEWLVDNLPKDSAVGFDPWTLSVDQHDRLKEALGRRRKAALRLEPTPDNLVDQIWAQDTARPMPPRPMDPIFIHPLEFAGATIPEKLAALKQKLEKAKVTHTLVTALDDVAWLFNLRGADTECSPLFCAYAVAGVDGKAALFVDGEKVPPEVQAHLDAAGVEVHPYEAVVEVLQAPAEGEVEYGYDGKQCNVELHRQLRANLTVESSSHPSPVALLKAAKNDVELEGMRACHIRDAVALVKYLVWLEDCIAAGTPVDEWSGALQLLEFRREQRHFRGLSFETISSAGPNAAVIHYRPTPTQHRPITADAIYLVDSGGQYWDGTTDVTRTVHLGQPTAKEVECFTRVLKGHLALRHVVVPDTAAGVQIDSWARAALWSVGLDYQHGTGHGVGSYLNVHEGPHGISLRAGPSKLQDRYVVSNEPGYYEGGQFGIRIENLCYFRPATTPYSTPGVTFLEMDDLTLVPIQAKLIDVALLTPTELTNLNAYHQRVLETVGPLVKEDLKVSQWLQAACQPLGA